MGTLLLEGATRDIGAIGGVSSRELREFKRVVEGSWRPALVLGGEVLVALASYGASVLLLAQVAYRNAPGQDLLSVGLFVAAGAALVATLAMRLYRRSIRHSNLLDVWTLAAAVGLNASFLAAFLFLSGMDRHVGVTKIVLDSAILTAAWGLLHFGPRVWRARQAAHRKYGARAVIVGAGDAGLAVLKALALDPASPYRPVALADDDYRKWGRTLFGVPVLGGISNLAGIASQTSADAILVCIPSATHAQMNHILEVCRRLNLPVKSLPTLAELTRVGADAKVSPRHLRVPRIEYLLQRDQFRVDPWRVRNLIEGKVVLVTGAGGSIGSELAREIVRAAPKRLLLLDKSENGLFYANLEFSERLGTERVKPILADLSSKGRIHSILRRERPDLVFHAAAHKHVSMVELHPEEAIRNNVLGTRNLAQAALESEVSSFVNISTDKAVAPCNFMGLSKKITELCIQEFARQASVGHLTTRFSNVRFGNVAGSTGSVIRLFCDQIQRGGPLRVTNPYASRYFMSVTEAVHLILGAAELGRNGETFVFEMGEPFNIYELAKTMALFSGLRPHLDIKVEFTGLKPGEKLAEQLWDDWEYPIQTSSSRILAIREKDPRSSGILATVHEMEQHVAREDTFGLMACISAIFPNFGAAAKAAPSPSRAFAQTHTLAIVGPIEAA